MVKYDWKMSRSYNLLSIEIDSMDLALITVTKHLKGVHELYKGVIGSHNGVIGSHKES